MIAINSVDFPQPDSPTSPTLSPRSIASEKSEITTARPAEVRYSTQRFSIDSSGIGLAQSDIESSVSPSANRLNPSTSDTNAKAG